MIDCTGVYGAIQDYIGLKTTKHKSIGPNINIHDYIKLCSTIQDNRGLYRTLQDYI